MVMQSHAPPVRWVVQRVAKGRELNWLAILLCCAAFFSNYAS
jgi:hypothetical protein